MNTKHFIAALGLAFAVAAPAFAQTNVSDGGDKIKTTEDGTTTKTKVASDGKSKVKAKNAAGDRLKATTKPRKEEKGAAVGQGVLVGGVLMTPDKDIVENGMYSADHTTLATAVQAAGLVETLRSTGPFTVFAPTNAAFNKLPAGTMEKLTQPDMKDKLTSLLTYHVVLGHLIAADLKDGQTLTTVEGETLTVAKKGQTVLLKDAKGGMATVTIPDIMDSNGVTHVVDAVLMPAK